MYYIISPIPVENLQKYHVPFVGNTQTRDIKTFFETAEGKEFLAINPIRISHEKDKTSAVASAAVDIAWIGLCYNCPLYISFMSENAFYSLFDLGVLRYTNFDKCTKMQNDGRFAEIPKNKQYFNGDFNEIVNICEKKFQFTLVGNQLVQYRLDVNKIEKL